MGVITVAGLSQAAQQYDNTLRTLPYFALEQVAAKYGMNVINLAEEHRLVNKRRNAGGTGPYSVGMSIDYHPELMKFYESVLKPEVVVFKTKDNILNYTDKEFLVKAGTPLDLKSKKHPLEYMIIKDMITSHSEDVVFALWFAERDTDVFSCETAFTGYFPTLDALATAGYLSTAAKNVVNSGAIAPAVAGVPDELAYNRLAAWLGSAHPLLRSSVGGVPQLIISEYALKNARESLRLKTANFQRATTEDLIAQLKEDAYIPNLEVVVDESYGTGSKLILQKKGNMDLGFDTNSAKQFVQVRNIYEDPNDVQFWLQAAYGVRFRDVHPKVFQTNELTNTSVNLAGDYNTSFPVSYPAVNGLHVKTAPTDVTYTAGDALALAGLEVVLTKADNTFETVPLAQFTAKGITTSPANGATLAAETEVTVTHTVSNKSDKFAITVSAGT